MRTTLLRLAVALATFGLGVTLAALWLGLSTSSDRRSYKRDSCRFRERTAHAPAPPVAPVVPVAPPAPPALEAPEAEPCVAGSTPAASGEYSRRFVAGGELNGRAISLPAPTYSPVARQAQVTGTVAVEVMVDECGQVESAEAVSGHPLLRQAAVEAARRAKFTPTRDAGERASVSGTLSYDFTVR